MSRYSGEQEMCIRDSNISVIGDNDEDMLLAVRELERVQGGYTIVSRGKVLDTLPLPIMGLMSDAGFEQVNELLQRMTKTAHEMGVPKGAVSYTHLILFFSDYPSISNAPLHKNTSSCTAQCVKPYHYITIQKK